MRTPPAYHRVGLHVFITRLGHGQFLEWIEREFAWGDDSARNFMRVFEMFKNTLKLPISAIPGD